MAEQFLKVTLMGNIEKFENDKILLRADKSIYHYDSILKASYKFTNNCFIHIASLDPQIYGIYFTSKKSDVNLLAEVNEFCNELIDQEIRYSLEQSNKSTKELIVKKAFFPFQNNE